MFASISTEPEVQFPRYEQIRRYYPLLKTGEDKVFIGLGLFLPCTDFQLHNHGLRSQRRVDGFVDLHTDGNDREILAIARQRARLQGTAGRTGSGGCGCGGGWGQNGCPIMVTLTGLVDPTKLLKAATLDEIRRPPLPPTQPQGSAPRGRAGGRLRCRNCGGTKC